MKPSLLLTNAYIHSVAEPYATALHIDQGVVAWLGSTEAGPRMVAATTTEPVVTQAFDGRLITPGFIDGFSTRPLQEYDERSSYSGIGTAPDGVSYASLEAGHAEGADGIFVDAEHLDRLADTLKSIKPPTQLLIESSHQDSVELILAELEQQPPTALMRSRHRIILNHELTQDQIVRMGTVHASVTLVPEVRDDAATFHAPIASLIAQGIQVATGTGQWRGSLWELLTALIEHDDPAQRVSTRAAFNTVTRDGVRVWPSRIAQAHMASGQIAAGAPADLNIWQVELLGVQAPDLTAAHWSTDKRAGTALLPILSSDDQAPQLERVIRNGLML